MNKPTIVFIMFVFMVGIALAATWGNLGDGDDAQLNMSYPLDNLPGFFLNPLEFAGVANVTTATALTNISYYDNSSGTFSINETLTPADITNVRAYYLLNELSGAVVDTANRTNATNNGATPGAKGKLNNSYIFVRSESDNISIASNLGITDYPFSFQAWVNTTTTGVEMTIMGLSSTSADDTDYSVGVNSTNAVFMLMRNTTLTDLDGNATVISDGEFHHIVVVANSSTDRQLWVDGISITNQTTDVSFDNTNINAHIGNSLLSGGNNWDGQMDEIAYYDKALNQTDILELFNSNLAKSFFLDVGVQPFYFLKNINNGILWAFEACAIDGSCTFTEANRTIVQGGITENSILFNSTTFETSQESFVLNITSPSGSPNTALLSYAGTNHTASISSEGNFFLISRTIDVPSPSASNNFFFEYTFSGNTVTSATRTQTSSPIDFVLCNATLTDSYINISFRNESTNSENISATIDSSWDYFLGSGTVKKQFLHSSSSENLNYSFCYAPADQTINTEVNLTYNGNLSQQRSFVSEPVLTNSTTQIVLFLLETSAGLFTQFQTIDIANNPLDLVKGVITRTLGGVTVTVASGLTDSSGLVLFFLNPDITYNALFSKSGLQNNAFTFVPTTDLRFVTMGSGVTVNGSNISIGLNYVVTPTVGSLANNTTITFGFNVSGNNNVDFIQMNISNQDNIQLATTSNNGLGFISVNVNTENHTKIIGDYIIRTGDENLTFSRTWIVGDEFLGDYSIQRQGSLYLDYQFTDFIRLLMVIAIIFGVVIFMSSNELADNNESKIAVIVLLIWIFSLIGWLNNPAVVSDTGIAQFGRQFGVAMISTVGAFFFIFRRIFV